MASTYIANTRITKGAHKEFREPSGRYQRERQSANDREHQRPRQQLIPDFVMVIMVLIVLMV